MKRKSVPTPLLIIVGPTASGKSDLAVRLARILAKKSGVKIAAEIISADSRQVYKGLDIGTGKITGREMKGVPHHLLDVADPRVPANSPQHFTVEKWRILAEQTIADIRKRGRLPIITGGTGFYISALLDGMKFPDVVPDKRLREQLSKKTAMELFEKLKKLDPRRARDMHANGDWKNTRRLIRAIEIATAVGTVPKVSVAQITKDTKYNRIFIGIDVPPEIVKKRIEKRLKSRLKKGMITEVKNLHAPLKGKSLSWKRLDELGLEYRFISRYLRGPHTPARTKEMTDALTTAIWRYAKRQMTWWKKDKWIVWVSPKKAESTAVKLLKNYLL